MKYLSGTAVWRVLVLLIAVLVGLLLVPSARATLVDGLEYATFLVAPSAEKAFERGERHFDVTDPYAYDLSRAEYYFRQAIELDPQYPHAHHQIARILFLKGLFDAALAQIEMEIKNQGEVEPNTYYVRGLIHGFREDYVAAEADYRTFLKKDPKNWAATNDLAWILLKDNRPLEALHAIDEVLPYWPINPWLFNNRATALYELERLDEAIGDARRASTLVQDVSEEDWAVAYPGNDPGSAGDGLRAFKEAVAKNLEKIEQAWAEQNPTAGLPL